MIKINGADLKTAKPANLDDQLIATTGCTATEIERLIAGGPDLTARALRPFLEPEALPGGALAAAIAQDGEAVAAIRKFYDGLAEPTAKTAKPE